MCGIAGLVNLDGSPVPDLTGRLQRMNARQRHRGMFAFAIWDARERTLFCARDRFGIKPFHYAVVDGVFAFASEAKALLPLLPRVETDLDGLKDYLAFQFVMNDKTLFAGVRQ